MQPKKNRKNKLVPIKDAILHFAPRKLRADLHEYNSNLRFKYSTATSQKNVPNVKLLSEAMGDLAREVFAAKEPIAEMANHLLQRLQEGELEAWGVMTRPAGNLEPQKIAAVIFEGRPTIKPNAGTVENLGRKFEVVKVRFAEDSSKTQTPAPSNREKEGGPLRSARGRSSKSAEIEQAISGLLNAGKDLSCLPRAKAYEQIRQYAKTELNANITLGYSDPVIQRCLIRTIGKRT